MAVITSDELTTAERKTLEQHSDGYHDCAEFWVGFADYQRDRCNCRNPWSNSVAAEAWIAGMKPRCAS